MNRRKAFSSILFFGVVITAFFLPGFGMRMGWWMFIGSLIVPLSATLVLYRIHFSLFVPTLFLVIYALSRPLIFPFVQYIKFDFPGVFFLIPIVIYLSIIVLSEKMRKEVGWLSWGQIDRRTWAFIGIAVFGSVLSLAGWAFLIQKDLSMFTINLPDTGPVLLILAGLAFAASNAFVEEFLARGILWDGLKNIFSKIHFVIFIQAVIFSIWHYHGFPGGPVGAVAVFIWSLLLGMVRYRSRGIFAPVLAHFLADLTIFIILIAAVNRFL